MILDSSITKKQTVALTGFLLILFVVMHLAGNLLIYAGPDAFNAYARQWHRLWPLLFLERILLFSVAMLHFFVIHILIIQNIKARGGLKRYAIDQAVGKRSFAERMMPWSGLYILVFVIFHILDFAAADSQGPRSYLHGQSYGLYGLVYNSFTSPIHSLLYVIAVCFLGLHLSHGFQSALQTIGFRPKYEWAIKKGSVLFAILMVIGFCSIPVYILLRRGGY